MLIDKIGLDPRFNPKELSGNWAHNADLSCRYNPFRAYNYNFNLNDDIRRWIIRRYIRPKYITEDLIKLFNKFNIHNTINLLRYVVSFKHIESYFTNLYKNYSTWYISELLGIPQSTIYRLLVDIKGNHLDRTRYSSKIQLEISNYIINHFKHDYIIEYQIDKYRIDLFDATYNLGIEIDFDWCHNKTRDQIRDHHINKLYDINIIRLQCDKLNEQDILNKLNNIYNKYND